MFLDRTVGLADRTPTEVVCPTDQFPVEVHHQGLGLPWGLAASGQLTNLRTDALHPFLRRDRSQYRTAPSSANSRDQTYTPKSRTSLRQTADPRLLLLHRELQLCHHPPHRR